MELQFSDCGPRARGPRITWVLSGNANSGPTRDLLGLELGGGGPAVTARRPGDFQTVLSFYLKQNRPL